MGPSKSQDRTGLFVEHIEIKTIGAQQRYSVMEPGLMCRNFGEFDVCRLDLLTQLPPCKKAPVPLDHVVCKVGY